MRYDYVDPADFALKQWHKKPPPIPKQNQLEDFHVKYGAGIRLEAGRLQGNAVGGGGPYDFINKLFCSVPGVLSPAGYRAYGALVYANNANKSVQRNGEIRAGDILTFRNSLFGGNGWPNNGDSMAVGRPDHAAVVVDWDAAREEVKAYEQGRVSNCVTLQSFKIGDLRCGEVKVWRAVGREWVGWDRNRQRQELPHVLG